MYDLSAFALAIACVLLVRIWLDDIYISTNIHNKYVHVSIVWTAPFSYTLRSVQLYNQGAVPQCTLPDKYGPLRLTPPTTCDTHTSAPCTLMSGVADRIHIRMLCSHTRGRAEVFEPLGTQHWWHSDSYSFGGTLLPQCIHILQCHHFVTGHDIRLPLPSPAALSRAVETSCLYKTILIPRSKVADSKRSSTSYIRSTLQPIQHSYVASY